MAASLNFLESVQPRALGLRALQGAGIALLIGLIFFYGDGGPLDFGFRVYFPLLTAAIGGAAGGIFFGLLEPYRSGGKKISVTALCAVVFLVAVWISAVAGLAVTGDWN